MNVQLQCVYSVSTRRHFILSRRARRHQRRVAAARAIITLVVVSALVIGYISYSHFLEAQAVTNDMHTACIATTVASMQNSSTE